MNLEQIFIVVYVTVVVGLAIAFVMWLVPVVESEKLKAYGVGGGEDYLFSYGNTSYANETLTVNWPKCTNETPAGTRCTDSDDYWLTDEVRGTGTDEQGRYSVDNCSYDDCVDADKETEQERGDDGLPEYVPPSDDENDQPSNIKPFDQ